MGSSSNIKHAVYMGPHTWEPCVPNSLTHRLDACQHLIITEQLELCGRNCIVSRQVSNDRVRNLDRIYLCPLCPGSNHRPTITPESSKPNVSLMKYRGKEWPNFGSRLSKTAALDESFTHLRQGPFDEDANARTSEINCESVLRHVDLKPSERVFRKSRFVTRTMYN